MASHQYNVTSIEKTVPPEGADGQNWYRYVIECDGSVVTGCRQGTLKQVTEHANSFAEEINARTQGRGMSPWAPRRSKVQTA